MNPPVTFPAPSPELKLPRPSMDKWLANVTEERRRLQEDQDALREREMNLREYEERLRNWQAQLDAGRHGVIPAAQGLRASLPGISFTPSNAAPATEESIQSGWEKLHRAREILEAEQNHLRDDRIVLREMEAAVKRREEAVAVREAQLAEREKLILAATLPSSTAPFAQIEPDGTVSKVTRITRAPFELAKSVFGSKR